MIASTFSTSVFFAVSLTLGAYVLGLWLRKISHLALLNPLLIATLIIILFLKLTGVSYPAYRQGAGCISHFLTPATVCLAIPLYKQLCLLKKNWPAILGGVAAGTAASLFGILLLCLLFRLTEPELATLLPKSVTTAIGLSLSEELGGVPSVTVAAILMTGIAGNMMASAICRLFRIEEPVARGVAIGCASHAIGTTRAMAMGPVEGAMSSLSLVLSGLMTVVAAPLICLLYR